MTDTYVSPLGKRYASREMLELFSENTKFRTWRRLWIALARAQRQLGLPVTEAQIAEMERFKNDINFDAAAQYERELRHDVMAHIHAYGDQCPSARPILHLGATSCFVGDNTDIIIMRRGLELLRSRLVTVMRRLAARAGEFKSLPTLGFTHFQPAQPVTVGKRIALWLEDLLLDFEEIEFRIKTLKLRGAKGTTGTQASFLALFDGDGQKADEMERLIAREMGFEEVYPVTGQTYSRKVDAAVLSTLSGIAQSCSKFSGDFRLLSHLKEADEPFENKQVGSSAMPYKRNPMRSERMSSLARVVTSLTSVSAQTAATQWFERTLDDSAARRIAIPEAFLATDALLLLYANIAKDFAVNPKVIERHLADELPFMATENILMEAVRNGGDRQELHERIRVHSIEAGKTVKREGEDNDLCTRIAGDPAFGLTPAQIKDKLRPELYIGRCAEQVDNFLREHIKPVLSRFPEDTVEDIRV